MREPKLIDYLLLTILALIWASAFFNIKIATYSYGPFTIAFLRIFFGAIPVVALCFFKGIKIEAFSKDWHWFASIGLINLVIPFFLIAYGVQKVQSNLAAILMASTPLSATLLAHLFTDNEKINFIKVLGVLVGFSGIVFLFSDNVLINESNFFSAFLILVGSTFYVIGGLLTIKISNKKNENVTASILIWATIFLIPITAYTEQPWNLNPSMESTAFSWVLLFSVFLLFQQDSISKIKPTMETTPFYDGVCCFYGRFYWKIICRGDHIKIDKIIDESW